MASNNTTLFHTGHSSAHSLIPAPTPRRLKHRNSAVAAALNYSRGKNRRHSSISSPVNFRQGFVKNDVVSARKLAAGLWQLRFVEVSGGDGGAVIGHGSLYSSSNSKLANVNYKNCEDKVTKYQKRRPLTILRSRNGLLCELEASMAFIKSSKEGSTKWNPSLKEASNESKIVHRRKLLENKKLASKHDSIVTVLLEELLQAQNSIKKLKSSQNSSKEKIKHFLQNLKDEKVLWKCKEQKKIKSILDELKDKLTRERKSKERMELLNTKLVHELDLANESAIKFRTNYESEKRERELTEEVCEELAKEIVEDKAKLERLMRDTMKIVKEVEEERDMMRMSEQWREERVQMKLSEAKNVLEDKYNQMVNLIACLQMFLRSRGDEVNNKEIENVELIKQAVESVNIQQILELSYNFSKSCDVFPIHIESSQSEMMYTNDETTISSSLCKDFVEGSFKDLELLGQGNSKDSINPHITRGMKGCIEWPKGIPKIHSKVIIPLEERVKSQKSQLQHILKPKEF